jgi:hypothetical protein
VRSLRTAGALFAAVLIVLVPTANYQAFSGIPLVAPLELILLTLVAPACCSPRLRRKIEQLQRARRPVSTALLIVVSAAAVGKVLLFVSGDYEGFRGCYQVPSFAVDSVCENSFDDTFGRSSATRYDRVLEFGPTHDSSADPLVSSLAITAQTGDLSHSDWRLGFLNALRYNSVTPDGFPRDRPPLIVTWEAPLDLSGRETLEVEYVGEATLRLGERLQTLPAAYERPATARIELADEAGETATTIEYRFEERDSRPSGNRPYARFRLTADGDVIGASAEPVWRAVAWLVDIVGVLLVLVFAAIYAWFLRESWLVAVPVAAAGLAASLLPSLLGLPQSAAVLAVTAAFLVALVGRPGPHPLLVGYLGVAYLTALRVIDGFPGFGSVLYRAGGADWLTYESHARAILDDASLRAGEDVFFVPAAIRYFQAFGHLLFGDGDVAWLAVILTLTTFGVFVAVDLLYRGARLDRTNILLGVGAGVLLVLLLNSETLVTLIYLGTSDYPAWMMIPLAGALLLAGEALPVLLLGSAFAGLVFTIRANMAPGVFFAFAGLVTRFWHGNRRWIVACAGVMAVAALLPAAHNVIYGGALELAPTNQGDPTAVSLKLSDLHKVFSDPATRQLLEDQLYRMFYFEPRLDNPARQAHVSTSLAIVMHALQALWLAALAYVIRHRRQLKLASLMALLIAPGALVIFVSYNPLIYYPRHIVAGHLGMGIAALYVFSPAAKKSTAAPARDPQAPAVSL